jgi:hypothetical protein
VAGKISAHRVRRGGAATAGRVVDVAKYLIPSLFLLLGLAIRLRAASLRSRRVPVSTLARILAAFALGVGGFMLALAIMTG